MTASAAPVDLAALPAVLRPSQPIVDGAATTPPAAVTGKFKEGQISGPYGPQFVGYGPVPELTIKQRWGGTLAIAAGVAALSGLLIVVA